MVLVTLLSKPIGADLAVAGTRELLKAGCRTAERTRSATWQHRVDALTRAHYRRFDESTSTRLEQSANWLVDTYRGDLRKLAEAAGQQPDSSRRESINVCRRSLASAAWARRSISVRHSSCGPGSGRMPTTGSAMPRVHSACPTPSEASPSSPAPTTSQSSALR